jgi:hypothetical protein
MGEAQGFVCLPTTQERKERMNQINVSASPVMNTGDLQTRPERDLTEIVAGFLTAGEGVVAHWVEYAKGVLLFVMAPGDERSGEFYVYDRKKGIFWLLALSDGIFGGYAAGQMRQKIKEFQLLEFAANPSRLAGLLA